MMMNQACMKTTSGGWRSSRRSMPSPQRYQHNRTGEDNADAHLKRQVMGREVVVAITKGKLDFGPWEQIFYGEFDGRRAQTGAGESHRGVAGRPAVGFWDSGRVTVGTVLRNPNRQIREVVFFDHEGHPAAHGCRPDFAPPCREMAVADPAIEQWIPRRSQAQSPELLTISSWALAKSAIGSRISRPGVSRGWRSCRDNCLTFAGLRSGLPTGPARSNIRDCERNKNRG